MSSRIGSSIREQILQQILLKLTTKADPTLAPGAAMLLLTMYWSPPGPGVSPGPWSGPGSGILGS